MYIKYCFLAELPIGFVADSNMVDRQTYTFDMEHRAQGESSTAPMSLTTNAPISARGGRRISSHLTAAVEAVDDAEAGPADVCENGDRNAELGSWREIFGNGDASGDRGDGGNGWRSINCRTYGGAC